MQHVHSPLLPNGHQGAYFGNPALKAETDTRFAAIPAKFITRDAWFTTRSLWKHLKSGGETPLTGCKLAHLSLDADFSANRIMLEIIYKTPDLAQHQILGRLKEKLNFTFSFCEVSFKAFDNAVYFARPETRKAIALQMLQAIQSGVILHRVTEHYQAMEAYESRTPARSYLDLIDVLNIYAPAQPVDLEDKKARAAFHLPALA